MKKFSLMMMCAIISVAALFATPASAAYPPARTSESSILSLIPASLVIEQKATLSDNTTVTVYYLKNGDECEVYSNDNLKGYSVDDLISLKSTSFRIVSKPEGKRIYHTTVTKARKIIKSLVNTYL